MSKLIKETEDERWYIKEKRTINDREYYKVRIYRKFPDRWRRVKDTWYKIEEEDEKRWKADFDIRDDYGEERN